MLKTALTVVTLCFAVSSLGYAKAEGFPGRPINFIVPFPAGGSMDTFSRPIAQKMSQVLGVPVVVSNRAGAGGGIGIAAIARAKPDGYTIGMSSIGNMVINPHIYPDLPYSPLKDFTTIGLAGAFVNVLVVNTKVPVNNVQELVALAKEQPGKLTFASAGNGSTNHLSGELLKLKTGADFLHVPYRGSGPALTDVIAGNVTFMFDTLNTSMPHIQAGDLRALAVTSPARSPFLPHVPTMNEAGIKDYARAGENMWWAVIAPKGLPPGILARLNKALQETIEAPDLQQKIKAQRLETMKSTPEQLQKIIKKDYERWGQIVREANIKQQ